MDETFVLNFWVGDRFVVIHGRALQQQGDLTRVLVTDDGGAAADLTSLTSTEAARALRRRFGEYILVEALPEAAKPRPPVERRSFDRFSPRYVCFTCRRVGFLQEAGWPPNCPTCGGGATAVSPGICGFEQSLEDDNRAFPYTPIEPEGGYNGDLGGTGFFFRD